MLLPNVNVVVAEVSDGVLVNVRPEFVSASKEWEAFGTVCVRPDRRGDFQRELLYGSTCIGISSQVDESQSLSGCGGCCINGTVSLLVIE